VPAELRLALLHERRDALAASSVPYSTAPTAGSLRGGSGEMIELFGGHARWMSEPGPFLDDLDAIYRRRWTVPAS